MRPKFKTPQEVADLLQTEKISLNTPRKHTKILRSEAKAKKIAFSDLANEAIGAYAEFIEESKRESKD